MALARAKRDVAMVRALEHDMRIAALRARPHRVHPDRRRRADSRGRRSAKKLLDWTGERWMIAIGQGATAPTLRETAEAKEEEKREGAAAHPVVRKVMDAVSRRQDRRRARAGGSAPEAPPPTDEDVGYAEPPTRTTTSEEAAMDIMGIMKKAQAMQSKLAETQEELSRIEVEGQSGGGLVQGDADRQGRHEGDQARPLAA